MFTPLPFSGPCYALQCCLSVCVSFYLSVPHKTLQKLLSLVRNILTFAQCNWHTHFGQNWSKVKVTRGSSKFSNRRYSMLTVGFKSMTAGISKCGYTAKLMFGFSQACVGAWLLLSSGITTRWNTKLNLRATDGAPYIVAAIPPQILLWRSSSLLLFITCITVQVLCDVIRCVTR